MRYSYWEQDSFWAPADYVVIGAGITGMAAALHLREKAPRARIVVLERGSFSRGASTRNAGFACIGSPTELLADLAIMPAGEVWELVARRWRGLVYLRRLLGDEAVRFVQAGGHEVFLQEDEEVYAHCLDVLPEFNEHLADITGMYPFFETARPVTREIPAVRRAIAIRGEGQLHPGYMMQAFYRKAQSENIEIRFGVEVSNWEAGDRDVTIHLAGGGRLRAARLLLATNGFASALVPDTDIRPARNLVLVTAPLTKLPWQGSFHYHQGYVYFRNIGRRVLIGGGRHLDKEGETTAAFGEPAAIRRYLEHFLAGILPPGAGVEITHVWSGIMGLGPDKVPRLRHLAPNVVLAAGLGGMGVALGSQLGSEAADLLA